MQVLAELREALICQVIENEKSSSEDVLREKNESSARNKKNDLVEQLYLFSI